MGAEECPRGARALDDLISLAEAAEISGLAAHTLSQQADKGKLRARKVGGAWITTHECLAEYLRVHARNDRGRSGSPGSPDPHG